LTKNLVNSCTSTIVLASIRDTDSRVLSRDKPEDGTIDWD